MKRFILKKRVKWPSETTARYRARKKGLKLRKCRRLEAGRPDFDTYQILAIDSGKVVFGSSLGMSIADCDTLVEGWNQRPRRVHG